MKLIFTLLLLVVSPLLSAIENGVKAPPCALTNMLDHSEVSLSRPGKVVYVDFWASWCGPCAQSMPFLNTLQEDLKGKGLDVIGINLDEEITEARQFLDKYPVKFTIATSPDGQCPKAFGVQAMPSSYLIDRKGNIRHVELGFFSSKKDELRQRVEQLLSE